MKNYETVVILSPILTDKQVEQQLESINTIYTKNEAVDLNCKVLGKRQLAYELNKSNYGIYVLITFKSDNQDLIDMVNKSFRINDNIVKHQTHRLSELEYNLNLEHANEEASSNTVTA